MLSTISHQGNANEKKEIKLRVLQQSYIKKTRAMFVDNMETLEPSFPASGYTNWISHFGKRSGSL